MAPLEFTTPWPEGSGTSLREGGGGAQGAEVR